MTRAYLAAGSNHEREGNLRKGLALLREQVAVVAVSPVYETAAVGDTDAASYLNAAIAIETDRPPQDIKALLAQIEDDCGRVRVDARGKKSTVVALDFDLLLYGEAVTTYDFKGKIYRLPHGDVGSHAHVTVPLAQLAPDVVHPETGQSLMTIAAQFTDVEMARRDDLQL